MVKYICSTCKHNIDSNDCNTSKILNEDNCWSPIQIETQLNRFLEILQPIAELIEKKNTDYGNSFDQLRTKYGPIGFHIRIADKLNRIEQLDANTAMVEDEKIEDTIKDIIGYCALELAYRGRPKNCP